MKTLEKVISIIKENIESTLNVAPDSNLKNDLGIDSFDTIMIVNAIEDEFSIEIDGSDLDKIKTANDAVRLLDDKYLISIG